MTRQRRTHVDDAGDSPRQPREQLRVGPPLHLSAQQDLAALHADVEVGLVEPERLDEQLAELLHDLLVAPGECADEIGAGDDPDQRVVLDDGKPLDPVLRH